MAAEAGIVHRRAVGSPRTQAVAVEGSNHLDPGEDLSAVYLVSDSHIGHSVVRTHPAGGSTGLGLVGSSPC